jgi:hypothetical protein
MGLRWIQVLTIGIALWIVGAFLDTSTTTTQISKTKVNPEVEKIFHKLKCNDKASCEKKLTIVKFEEIKEENFIGDDTQTGIFKYKGLTKEEYKLALDQELHITNSIYEKKEWLSNMVKNLAMLFFVIAGLLWMGK